MEESPTFREPQLRVERPETNNPGIDFTIVAQYVPQLRKENN
jgi:hypothetical protein